MITDIENEEYLLPTSYAQERIWFFEKMVPNSATYNIPLILKIKGSINTETMRKTLFKITERHEVLRTTICEVEGKPMQKVSLHNSTFSFKEKEKEKIDKEIGFNNYLKQFAHEPFRVREGPLIRFELIQMEDNSCYLLINVHHIIFDAWSIELIRKEIIAIYSLLEEGNEDKLEQLELQYADYANWEKEVLNGGDKGQKINFWKGYLNDTTPMLDIPTDYIRPKKQSYNGDNIIFNIPNDLFLKSRSYSQSSTSTLYTFYLAVFKILLYKYTMQTDIVVGSPVSNRSEEFTQKLIGFFVNTLPIRSNIMPDSTFDNFLKGVVTNFFKVYENSEVPFEKIVQELKPERNSNTHPFFQVIFNLNEQQKTPNKFGIEIETESINTHTSKFDLVLNINCDANEGYGEIEYNSDLFSAETIEKMIKHFLVLLEDILSNPNKPVSEFNVLSEMEKKEILYFKKSLYQNSLKFVHELFEEQIKKGGDHCAVKDKYGEWTYSELDRRSNQIGNELLSQGVTSNSIIGIQMKRSNEQIATLFGVLKIGCSYVPIDPANPEERTNFILSDADAAILITDDPGRTDVQGIPVTTLEESCKQVDSNPNVNLDISSRDLIAYQIYTSGTTGKPKGLKISHASLINHLESHKREFPYMKNERVLQHINYTFDPSVLEIFGPLLTGNTIVLTDQDRQFDVDYLSLLISEQQITRAQILHSLLEKILDKPSFFGAEKLLYVFTGGEALNSQLVQKYFKKMPNGIPLINLYGPSEATVASTFYHCKEEDNYPVTPIGKPFSNYHLVILDDNQKLVPDGVVGELYIGGESLSNGYVNNTTLNQYSFIHLDFPITGKYYRTGDMVKRLKTGDYVFVSRKDSQVKIRGFRIELNEIKRTTLNYREIKAAAIVVKSINNDKKIFAFLVKHKDSSITANEIKNRLSNELPYYMVPNAIVWINELPVTSNGKLDENKFPFTKNDLLTGKKRKPDSFLEKELTNLWKEILCVEDIGVDDDFFDLGGHSIKVIELIGYIRDKLNFQVPITAIFQYRTVYALANYLKSNKPINSSRIIVQLKGSNSSERPLFLIHPGGGGVLCYLPLTDNIKMDMPIYGIQSVGYDQDIEPYASIPLMAERYVIEMKKVQKTGPYRLAGWSMGGTIAFEMAKLLRTEGEEVSFIGLLDAHPFGRINQKIEREDSIAVWAKSLDIQKGKLKDKTQTERYMIVLAVAKKRGILPKNAGIEDVKRIIKVMGNNNIASDHYMYSEPIDRDLVVFKCLEKDTEYTHGLVNPMLWKERTTKNIVSVNITGHHNNIMKTPHVELLGQKITVFLERS